MTSPTTPSDADINALIALHKAPVSSDTLAALEAFVARLPSYVSGWQVLGSVRQQLGDVDGALVAKERAVELQPNDPHCHNNLANTLAKLGRLNEAEAAYRRAFALDAKFSDAYINLADVLSRCQQHDEAVALASQGLAIAPNSAIGWRNLGNAHFGLKQYEKAIAAYERCISVDSTYKHAYSNLSACFGRLERYQESKAAALKALEFDPQYAEALCNLGNALHELDELEEAERVLRASIALNDQSALAFYNLGNVLYAFGQYDEARQCYERSRDLNPEFPDTHLNLGMLNLLTEQGAKGFEGYNMRFLVHANRVLPQAFRSPPPTDLRAIAGKRIAVHWEQGLGDTIQFCRFVPLLAEMGAEVDFYPQPRLLGLLGSLQGGHRLVPHTFMPGSHDLYLSTMALTGMFYDSEFRFGRLDPYLAAESARTEFFRRRIGSRGFRIGICWQGSNAKIDRGRSFPLRHFQGLSRIPGVRLISLHKGSGSAQLDGSLEFPVETLGDDFDVAEHAFLDTAAAMQNCDLIITSDTAVAHLAGALGCPTWVLLRLVPDWRWYVGRDSSHWYPSIRLFRQKSRGDWDTVFQAVEEALKDRLNQAFIY